MRIWKEWIRKGAKSFQCGRSAWPWTEKILVLGQVQSGQRFQTKFHHDCCACGCGRFNGERISEKFAFIRMRCQLKSKLSNAVNTKIYSHKHSAKWIRRLEWIRGWTRAKKKEKSVSSFIQNVNESPRGRRRRRRKALRHFCNRSKWQKMYKQKNEIQKSR